MKKMYQKIQKYLSRTCTILGAILLGGLILPALFGVLFTDNGTVSLPDDFVLTAHVSAEIPETHGGMSGLSMFGDEVSLTLIEFSQALREAITDDRVQAFAVNLEQGHYSLAQVQELRLAVRDFRAAGKKTYVYTDSFGALSSGMGQYYLASSFDEVWVNPLGTLNLTGIGLQVPFIRQFLALIGVQPEFIQKGRYKGAAETPMRSTMSADVKDMTQGLIDDLFGQMALGISRDRQMSEKEFNAWVKKSPMNAEQGKAAKLVDKIGYWDDFLDGLNGLHEHSISIEHYAHGLEVQNSLPIIKVITLDGAIMNQYDGNASKTDPFTAEAVANALKDAGEDASVKAIVFRLNSPGGTPMGSEYIRRALLKAKMKKPVIVSMGDMAASGGYWVASAADHIVAYPATLTGSIGVFAGKMNAAPLMEKLGVNWETLTTHDRGAMWSQLKPLSGDERKVLDALIGQTYDAFIDRVMAGRKIEKRSDVEALAQGRVFTGWQAIKTPLIDQLGGFDLAVIAAKKMAKIDQKQKVKLSVYPKPASFFDVLLQYEDMFSEAVGLGFLKPLATLKMFLMNSGVLLF